jgi:hypothetical protein
MDGSPLDGSQAPAGRGGGGGQRRSTREGLKRRWGGWLTSSAGRWKARGGEGPWVSRDLLVLSCRCAGG